MSATAPTPSYYDRLKTSASGQKYSGMPIGAEHHWLYPDGVWNEQKLGPDRWRFSFHATKRREHSAPVGSGAGVGTQYHWYVLGHQRVKKVDQDSYETFMEGLKYKVGHKRPHWQRWSNEYPEQASEKAKLTAILSKALRELQAPSSLAEVPSA